MHAASFHTWLKQVLAANRVIQGLAVVVALVLTAPDASQHSLQTSLTTGSSAVENAASVSSEKTKQQVSSYLLPAISEALPLPVLQGLSQGYVITSSLTHRDASTTGAARAPPRAHLT